VQPWVAFLLPQCDGKLTVRQLLEFCKQNSFVHPETPLAEFTKLLMVFIAGGFLEVEEFKLPVRAVGGGQKEESNSRFKIQDCVSPVSSMDGEMLS
jgi:hypothetical protein